MKNVMYSSYGFGSNPKQSGQFESTDWAHIQRRMIKKYCDNNNIELRVIGYDNQFFNAILKNVERERDQKDKTHAPYTLSAIAAIFDFVHNTKEKDAKFFWMHLDMAINKMHESIFDYIDPEDDEMVVWSHFTEWPTLYENGNPREWDIAKMQWLKALAKTSNINIDTMNRDRIICNCSYIAMTKRAAIKFVDVVKKYVDIFDTSFTIDSRFIEETVLELVHIISREKGIDLKLSERKGKNQTPIAFCDYDQGNDKNSLEKTLLNDYDIFIHFWGTNKKHIIPFYKSRKIL